MPIPSRVLEAIILELRELEVVAARMRELDEHELLDLYPRIAAVREALRALTEELELRGLSFRWGMGRGPCWTAPQTEAPSGRRRV